MDTPALQLQELFNTSQICVPAGLWWDNQEHILPLSAVVVYWLGGSSLPRAVNPQVQIFTSNQLQPGLLHNQGCSGGSAKWHLLHGKGIPSPFSRGSAARGCSLGGDQGATSREGSTASCSSWGTLGESHRMGWGWDQFISSGTRGGSHRMS